MPHLERENIGPLSSISSLLREMTKMAHRGEYDYGQTPNLFKVVKFPLDFFVSAFQGVSKEHFLTEAPLKLVQQSFESGHFDSPQKVKVTLAAFPCTLDGMEIPLEEMDDNLNAAYPYFRVLFSNPEDSRGLALATGVVRPAPYYAILPEEIAEDCSFLLDINSDPAYVAETLDLCYRKLQSHIKGKLV